MTLMMSGPYLSNVYFEGWTYKREPPLDISNEEYLDNSDPWLVLCCVLERAKCGDFSAIPRLSTLYRHEDVLLRDASDYLLAATGTIEQLGVLERRVAEGRMDSVDCAVLSGSLQFVDHFVAGYRSAFGETTRDAIIEGIVDLLGCEERFVRDCLLATVRSEGEQLLYDAADRLREQHGSRTSIRGGVPMRVHRLIDEIDEILTREDDEDYAVLQSKISWLQTIVGFSQTLIFTEHEQGVTWDSRKIRAELESIGKRKFEPGCRYFFGHPAPL